MGKDERLWTPEDLADYLGVDAPPVAPEGHRAEWPSCGSALAIRPRRGAALVRVFG
jgi:hypothetical protein